MNLILSHVRRGGGKGRRERREPGLVAMWAKVKMGQVTKMAGLNMEEASLWAGGFVESRVGYASHTL